VNIFVRIVTLFLAGSGVGWVLSNHSFSTLEIFVICLVLGVMWPTHWLKGRRLADEYYDTPDNLFTHGQRKGDIRPRPQSKDH
jgi:hypothetical protein